MDSFAEAIAAVKDLKHEGIVGEYAIGGAMALIFWSEPTATFDLDVFVASPGRAVGISGAYLCFIRTSSFEPRTSLPLIDSQVSIQIGESPRVTADANRKKFEVRSSNDEVRKPEDVPLHSYLFIRTSNLSSQVTFPSLPSLFPYTPVSHPA